MTLQLHKQELSVVGHGTKISVWSLDTAAPFEAIMAPGGLDALAATVAVGDRIAFIAGPADVRTHGDLAVLAASPAVGDEPAVMQVHLIWSTRPLRTGRKAAA